MKTRRRNLSDDTLAISRRNTRSKKTSVNGTTENSKDSIPIDLIIEIFSRLPAKYITKYRCLSKLWASILRHTVFTELFLTTSLNRPQLLFACRKHGKFLFLSSPQPQNPDVNSSPVVCANRLMHFSFYDYSCEISGPVHGRVCLSDKRLTKICNPTTGQSLTLPKMKWRRAKVKSYFGYDPIDKQFKVLSMSFICSVGDNEFDNVNQILTIDTRKNMSWRKVECCIPPHFSLDNGILIDGVLYYRAAKSSYSTLSMIVCFDFRSENFKLITIAEDCIRLVSKGNLVNYNGKLGSVVCDRCGYVDGRNGRSGSIELWVLEDDERMEWSNCSYVLSVMWQNVLRINCLYFVGVTRTNEIVFSPMELMSFCVFYYNIERNTIIKVEIQGMEAFESTLVYDFLDHVEDLNLM